MYYGATYMACVMGAFTLAGSIASQWLTDPWAMFVAVLASVGGWHVARHIELRERRKYEEPTP